jgi:hypothetical protein
MVPTGHTSLAWATGCIFTKLVLAAAALLARLFIYCAAVILTATLPILMGVGAVLHVLVAKERYSMLAICLSTYSKCYTKYYSRCYAGCYIQWINGSKNECLSSLRGKRGRVAILIGKSIILVSLVYIYETYPTIFKNCWQVVRVVAVENSFELCNLEHQCQKNFCRRIQLGRHGIYHKYQSLQWS